MPDLNPEVTRLPSTQPLPRCIGGRWAGTICGVTFETLDPGNGSVLARVAAGDVADVEAAVVAELLRSGSRQATGGVSELPAK